jgi:ribosomal protein S12 methylthiotransferase
VKTTKPRHIRVVTLGCSKNTVDSEVLMAQLRSNNLNVLHDYEPGKADTVVINTCGFIGDAKEESIDTILNYIRQKEEGKLKRVFVMGCLSERYKPSLKKEIPEVDEYFGVNDLSGVIRALGAEYRDSLLGERILTTPSHYAYLKIAEGCDRRCSFCAIPGIRGKHISKPIELVIKEAELLADKGVKELLLISQDLTFYGADLYGKPALTELVRKLSDLERFDWIRLHYTFPSGFPADLIDLMGERENICNYIDIPLQHISDRILKSMRRGVNGIETRKLIADMRNRIPHAAIRTAFIVGYPGETEQEFEELKQFIQEVKFERMGVFTYSHEEDTHAFNLKDDIPGEVKNARAAELMALQQEISANLNFVKIDQKLKVLIDRKEGNYYIGRTEFDSPEVDNEVLIEDQAQLQIGSFYTVLITAAEDFDLHGIINENL